MEEVYTFMRTKNTGLCKLWGKSFGKIMPHFIIRLDEMCLMSDCHGDLRVFAASDKKKQEKLLQDCRCSITAMRTGTVANTTGPTMFPFAIPGTNSVFNPIFCESCFPEQHFEFFLFQDSIFLVCGTIKSKSTGHWSNGGENSWTFSLKIGKTLHPTPHTQDKLFAANPNIKRCSGIILTLP